MATYTNSVPLSFSANDVVNLTKNGSFVLPKGQYRVVVKGGNGGKGGYATVYASGTYNAWGGDGGKGAYATFELLLDASAAIVAETGAGGIGDSGNSPGPGGNVHLETASGSRRANAGSGGALSKLTVNGVLIAHCTGGGGGTGGYVAANGPEPSEQRRNSVVVTQGVKGADGKVVLAPAGYTAGLGGTHDGYIQIVSLNSPPSTPTNVRMGTPLSNREILIEWDASIDPDGDAVSYVVEARTDSGVYVTIGTTADTKLTAVVPGSGNTYQVRVKAVDSWGAESGYGIGPAKAIVYNYNPIISGNDENKGDIAQPFSYAFTVDDPDAGDILAVRVLLDGVELQKIENAQRNYSYTADLEEYWIFTPNGAHELKIICTDDKGGSAVRAIGFSRITPGLHLMLANPIQPRGGGIVKTLQAIFYYDAPANAPVEILVSNDALAASPDWHDFTAYLSGTEVFEFPDEPDENEAGFSAQIKITKPEGFKGQLTFTGATFMLNANGKESEKWAQNILFTRSFTGNLTGAANAQAAFNIVDSLPLVPQFIPLGTYATLSALKAVHPTGESGDAWVVGTETDNTVYIWDTNTLAWVNIGKIVGVVGRDGTDGKNGADGKDGAGLVVMGRFDSPADLQAAHPVGEAGETYATGTALPYEFYQFDAVNNAWFSIGNLQGPPGGGVEYGSNAQGEYWQFDDGLQICIRPVYSPVGIGSGASYTCPFPAWFVTPPAVALGAFQNVNLAVSNVYANSVIFYGTNSGTVNVSYIAIGRWKY